MYELSAKDFIQNPYKNIRKYITELGEYTGKVISFPKGNSGVIVQLDNTGIKQEKKMLYGYLMRII